MIKAIVYTSKTGTTKAYAQMLSKDLNIPNYTLQEAKKKLHKKDQVIYLGWLMAGMIKKLNAARKEYDIKIVCAVGMMPKNETYEKKIKETNNIQEPCFYSQGGYVQEKQKGFNKIIINQVIKMLKSKIEQKTEKTSEDIMMLDMINNGTSCVKQENIAEIIKYVKTI